MRNGWSQDDRAAPGWGRPTVRIVDAAGRPVRQATVTNQWQHDWGAAAARALGYGTAGYTINAAYVEYANLADPGDTVTPPSYDRSEGRTYYDGLALTADRDYVRVPIGLPPALETEPGYTLPDGQGNRLVFHVLATADTGVHGRAFHVNSNSKVYGLALVVAPDWDDPTADLVFARAYLPTAQQLLQVPGGQIGLTYPIVFP